MSSSDESPKKSTLDEIADAVSKVSPEEIEEAAKQIARRRASASQEESEPPFGLRQHRPFSIEYSDPKHPEWSSLDNRPIKVLQGCSFGFAEEIIGLIEYETAPRFRVGIGESLRPYEELYLGDDIEKASSVFVNAILSAAYTTEKEDESGEA